jgi:hypothetical protein
MLGDAISAKKASGEAKESLEVVDVAQVLVRSVRPSVAVGAGTGGEGTADEPAGDSQTGGGPVGGDPAGPAHAGPEPG